MFRVLKFKIEVRILFIRSIRQFK